LTINNNQNNQNNTLTQSQNLNTKDPKINNTNNANSKPPIPKHTTASNNHSNSKNYFSTISNERVVKLDKSAQDDNINRNKNKINNIRDIKSNNKCS